jgi:hypothetical protein
MIHPIQRGLHSMKNFQFWFDGFSVLGIFWSFSFLTWTKLTLGAGLAFLGAFFRNDWGKNANPDGGKATIKFGSINIGLNGGLRFAVIVVGLVIVTSSYADVWENVKHRFPGSAIRPSSSPEVKGDFEVDDAKR